MDDSEYRGGTTIGSKLGCVAAAIVGVPLFSFLVIVNAIGDCAPGVDCKKPFFPSVVLPVSAVAVILFLMIRLIVNALHPSD